MSTFITELIIIISLFMLIFGIIICCVYTDSSDTYSRQLNKFKNSNFVCDCDCDCDCDCRRYGSILTEIKICPSRILPDKKLK